MLSILTNKRLKGHLHVSLILCSLLFLFYWFQPPIDNFLMSTPCFHCFLASFCSSPQSVLLNCQYESSPIFSWRHSVLWMFFLAPLSFSLCSINCACCSIVVLFIEFYRVSNFSFIFVLTFLSFSSEVCSLPEFVSFVFSLVFWYLVVIHGGLIRYSCYFSFLVCLENCNVSEYVVSL